MARAHDFYEDKYCISLDFEEVKLSSKQEMQLRKRWDSWYDAAERAIGGQSHFYKTTLPLALVDDFHSLAIDVQSKASAAQAGIKLLTVWMNYYIGRSENRDTLCSATQDDIAQVGIDWVDRGSKYMLSHELIHALGKKGPGRPGKTTWGHDSPCHNALSTVTRKIGRPQDLSGRYLEFLELQEIYLNRGGGVLHP